MAGCSAPVQRLLDRLKAIENVGSGWQARCPAHDDKTPSLSINEGDDGRALLCCHAGCELKSILSALDLSERDLFVSNAPIPKLRGRAEVESAYPYRDNEQVRFEVCRLRDAQGKKTFLQLRYHDGRVVWGLRKGTYKLGRDGEYRLLKPGENPEGVIHLPAVEKILYRLPDIQKAIGKGWIVVCEGEKDADNGAELGFATTTNPGGAGKWQESYSAALRGARVAVVPDNDEPGRKGAQKIVDSLRAQEVEAYLVDLGGTEKGYDLSDWITEKKQDGLTEKKLRQALLEKIEAVAIGQASTQKPAVVLGFNQKDVTDQALTLLASRSEFYQRCGKLVQIVTNSPGATDGSNSSAASSIAPVTQARILEILSDCAKWTSEKGGRRRATPDWLARTILGRPSWPAIRRLEGIVGFPILHQDGTIHETPGYDPKTELYYSPTCTYPPFPAVLDAAAARKAARELREVVGDFPFSSEADFAALVAGLLTVIGRSTFEGPAPLFVIDSNMAGTGKSLLVDVISMIATGKPAPRMTQTRKDEEERKRITSLVVAGEVVSVYRALLSLRSTADLEMVSAP